MNNATMLYRPNGPELIHGYFVEHTVVDEPEVSDMLAQGWFRTAIEAGESVNKPEPVIPADDAPVTRAELEQKARDLNIKFDGRTNDKKLGDLIAAKLKG